MKFRFLELDGRRRVLGAHFGRSAISRHRQQYAAVCCRSTIRLYQDDSGQATSIVQCKAWGERLVGVKPVRELLGVMTHEKISKAFFMTSGRFTDDAKVVAKSNRITLIDGEMFFMMIQRLPDVDRESLLSFAVDGDYKTPTCPSCGIKMKAVSGKNGRADFWGCH